MVHSAGLNKRCWGEAVLTAAYLVNRSPSKAIKTDKTPYELWHNQKPKLKFLRVFGCTAYVHNKTRKHKFDDKSIKGILVGYVPNGYKIFIAKTRKFIVARDVIFDEVNFKTSRQELDDMIKIDRYLGANTDNFYPTAIVESADTESDPSENDATITIIKSLITFMTKTLFDLFPMQRSKIQSILENTSKSVFNVTKVSHSGHQIHFTFDQ
jgi:hypothetical protein